MKYFTHEVKIALVAVMGIVVLFIGLEFLKGLNVFSSASEYYACFEDVEGLSASSPVYANGYRVGVVKKIKYDYNQPDKIVASLQLDNKLSVPRGTEAEIASDLLGNVKLELKFGSNPLDLLQVGDTLKGGVKKGTMDKAEEAGYIDPATRVTMFKNDLVMVTSANNADINEVTLDDIAAGKYTVCVGDDSVPAGNYANQSLSTVGCFKDPDGKTGSESAGKANGTDAYAGTPLEGKVVTDTSVGNVCKHAESGDVDIAFVYTSDVERFGGVKVGGTVPGDTHKNITYPGAVCAQSTNAAAAKAFLDWCMTDKGAAEVWQKWGFELAA